MSAGYEIHRYSGSAVPDLGVAKAVAEVAQPPREKGIMLGSGMPNAYLIPLLPTTHPADRPGDHT